jgi:hypothetical protein
MQYQTQERITPRLWRAALCGLLLLQCAACSHAQGSTTAVELSDIDPSATAEWVQGRETARNDIHADMLVFTRNTVAGQHEIKFGEASVPGPRHLRIGFRHGVAAGSIVTCGDVSLSILRSSARYPGRLGDDSDWAPVVQTGPHGADYNVWLLPPGTEVRALRLTHNSPAGADSYEGHFWGAYLLKERYANITSAASASASDNQPQAYRLINGDYDAFRAWSNGPQGVAEPVSESHPAVITLTWPSAVTLRTLCFLWAGFGHGDIDYLQGNDPSDPTAWKSAGGVDCVNGYPGHFQPNWLDTASEFTTRAIRVRITSPTTEQHEHLRGGTHGGRRVWLGEILALAPVPNSETNAPVIAMKTEPHPPIPIHFHLDHEANVTLTIDDANGVRVRNLISDTPYPAGDNTVWWDGQDDVGRDRDAASHGIYYIPGKLVAPGKYVVRGLFHDTVSAKYQMTVYTSGHPPWKIKDKTGAWLSDHSAPSSVIYLPGKHQMLIGSLLAESGDGLVLTDMQGRKLWGTQSVGGDWTAATVMARDEGRSRDSEVDAYTGSATDKNAAGEIRLASISGKRANTILKYPVPDKTQAVISGLAAYNRTLAVALPALNQIIFVDSQSKNVTGQAPAQDVRGLNYDSSGRLYALIGNRLQVSDAGQTGPSITWHTVIDHDLEDPQQLCFGLDNTIYITDRGGSHQVKVFSSDGKLVRAIGTPGKPSVGPYNPDHMNNPDGVAVTEDGSVWVAEYDIYPKRVSVWSRDGKLERAFYGPWKYGGGGEIDYTDPSRYFLDGMEFHLDWDAGTSTLKNVYFRLDQSTVPPITKFSGGFPQTPIYAHGHRYLTDSFNTDPIRGFPVSYLWEMKGDAAIPVAAVGQVGNWDILKTDAFKAVLPPGADPADARHNPFIFVWSDRNGDGKVQPDELTFRPGQAGFITVQRDLSFITTMGDCFRPTNIGADGAPSYDASKDVKLTTAGQLALSDGGGQVLEDGAHRLVLTTAPKPFGPDSVGGTLDGKPAWSYPSLWPGLHPSHVAPEPDFPGELIGTTRVLGFPFALKSAPDISLWAIAGNMGSIYVFTTDGLFVTTLFEDGRHADWAMPIAERGMDVTHNSVGSENFGLMMMQVPDGKIYVSTWCSLVQIDGLETTHRLPDATIDVSAEQLAAARDFQIADEAWRQEVRGSDSLTVKIRPNPPTLDPSLADWSDAQWVTLDSRRTQEGKFGSVADTATAAMAVSGDRLYAVFKTADTKLLRNTIDDPALMFKGGGALDIAIGTDPAANPNRTAPVAGDLRLLVSVNAGKPIAMLYRPVASGSGQPKEFRSPGRVVTMDRVEDVSSMVQLSDDGKGDYEVSIPLQALNLSPKPGLALKGDIGVLRGNGFETLQRVYWHNKATGLTADIPGEAQLTPLLWGTLRFSN